jgi:hypothetical protein
MGMTLATLQAYATHYCRAGIRKRASPARPGNARHSNRVDDGIERGSVL